MSSKFVAKETPAPKSRAAAAPNKVVGKKAPAVKTDVRVSIGVAPGGFTVYGSPIKPKRLTQEQIAVAVAELD